MPKSMDEAAEVWRSGKQNRGSGIPRPGSKSIKRAIAAASDEGVEEVGQRVLGERYADDVERRGAKSNRQKRRRDEDLWDPRHDEYSPSFVGPRLQGATSPARRLAELMLGLPRTKLLSRAPHDVFDPPLGLGIQGRRNIFSLDSDYGHADRPRNPPGKKTQTGKKRKNKPVE